MDLSDNKTPFGLLTEEERKHLRNWPHGVEMYCADDAWDYCRPAAWLKSITYRTKPAPQVHWANDYGKYLDEWFESRVEADINFRDDAIAVIRREWTEGQPPKYFTEEV